MDRKRIAVALLAVVSVVFTLGAVEVASRLLYGPPYAPYMLDGRHVKLLGEVPEKDRFIADFKRHKDRPFLLYHDYHLFSLRPFRSETLNFTGYHAARYSPDSVPLGQADHIVWMFGGSTMQNSHAPDRWAVANQAAIALNRAWGPTTVMNFGSGTFQSGMELIKFQDLLRRVPPAERPDVALFYDGFNDANHGFMYGAGHIQADLAGKLRLLVERRYLKVSLYGLSAWLADRSTFYRRFLWPLITPREVFEGIVRDGSPENLTRSVDIYLDNRRMIEATCREMGITPVFVLQPLVVTKQGRSAEEEEVYAGLTPGLAEFVRGFYAETERRLKGRANFFDLSGLLDGNGRTDFYDLGHTAPRTGEPLGAALAAAIVRTAGTAEAAGAPPVKTGT